MPAIAYPIAAHASDILKGLSPIDLAAREREATEIAGARVIFVSETLDPGFATREEAQTHFTRVCPGLIEQAYAQIKCRMIKPSKTAKRLEPSFETGRRWPQAKRPPDSQWQLTLSYWKPFPASAGAASDPDHINPALQARAMRKQELGLTLTPTELRALAHTPMIAYRPQKALDVGLFEYRPPDDPTILIPDE